MRPAADLLAPPFDVVHLDHIAVFGSEYTRRVFAARLFDRHLLTFYRDIRRDCRVDEVLHRLLFLRRKRAREVEVKAQALCRDVAALLHDGVVAQHLFEPGEQQVRRRVQAQGRHARIRKAALKTLLRAGVRFLLMLAEGFLITRFIHGKTLFRRQFLCKFDRESECVVQPEGALARDFLGL